MIDNDETLVQAFLEEATELAGDLINDILELDANRSSREVLNKIFRTAHTIKGSSSFLGQLPIAQLTHNAEDLLNRLRTDGIHYTDTHTDALLSFADELERLLGLAERNEGSLVNASVISALKAALDGSVVCADADAGVSIGAGSDAGVSIGAGSASSISERKESVRVSTLNLEEVADLVGELVIARNRLSLLYGKVSEKIGSAYLQEEMSTVVSQVSSLTTGLQISTTKMRLVPIDAIFRRFPRLVRDLSRKLNKPITLDITGGATGIDRDIIEYLTDPLIHIIRNACDHGIESPEERATAGKDATGTVSVSASYDKGFVNIVIKDDGKGLDRSAIVAKGIANGLIDSDEFMSDKEVFDLIFEPGFSTATNITNVSGRGVGMDIVRSSIYALSGSISISSTLGAGSTFGIRLPLTLAIIDAIIVDVGGDPFALALHSVVEVTSIPFEDIMMFDGSCFYRLREQTISVLILKTLYDIDTYQHDGNYILVVLNVGTKTIGVLVDKVLAQEEIVVKPLNNYFGMSKVTGFSGATILGNGQVCLIIDIEAVVNALEDTDKRSMFVGFEERNCRIKNGFDPNNEARSTHIAIVEDSSSDRRNIKSLLIHEDGLSCSLFADATSIINSQERFDLAVIDIVMEQGSGELVALKLLEQGRNFPVIFISSKVDALNTSVLPQDLKYIFMRKPLRQQEFITAIYTMIGKDTATVATEATKVTKVIKVAGVAEPTEAIKVAGVAEPTEAIKVAGITKAPATDTP